MRPRLLTKSAVVLAAWAAAAVPLSAALTFAPPQPMIGQTVAFTLTDSFPIDTSRGLTWNFGDGTVMTNNAPAASHAFSSAGSFTVRVDYWAWSGPGPPIPRTELALVTVREPPPPGAAVLAFTPAQPGVGQGVIFTIMDSLVIETAMGVNWNFGDGSSLTGFAPTASHVYAYAGSFTARVDYWARPVAGAVLQRSCQATVTVVEVAGPRAEFRISFLQLRFDDGKAYKVVGQGRQGLRAYADVKVEGTGILQFEWLVDGAPFRQATTALSFARTAVMDSGGVPGLPTVVPGMHEVTLRLLAPAGGLAIPVIRYFVAMGEAGPAVSLDVETASGLDGRNLLAGPGRVRLEEGGTCLLRGNIGNDTGALVALGLFRVTADGAVIDLQLVRDLMPGERRPFTTSYQRPAGGAPDATRTVVLSFYDISRKTASRLATGKVEVID